MQIYLIPGAGVVVAGFSMFAVLGVSRLDKPLLAGLV